MKYCKNCGNEMNSSSKYCTKCGSKFDNKSDLSNNNKKNKNIILFIIMGIFVSIVFIILFATFVIWCIKDTEKTKKENITRCYSEEAYDKLNSLFGTNYNGNFENEIECSKLEIETSNYKVIDIVMDNDQLLGIYVKDGLTDKYVYYIDKSYDIYDPDSLELKEKADENLVKEREKKEKEEEEIKAKKVEEEKKKKERLKKIKKLINLGFSEEEASAAYDLLSECGITKLSNLKSIDPVDGMEAYTLEYKSDTLVTFYCNNKVINKIFSGDVILYDINTGEKKNIEDFHISVSEMSTVRKNAMKVVKENLKSPSTAKFPGSLINGYKGWSIKKSEGNYLVSSYVDAQNSFGATIRSYFTIEYVKNGDNYEIKTFIFDGQQIK